MTDGWFIYNWEDEEPDAYEAEVLAEGELELKEYEARLWILDNLN